MQVEYDKREINSIKYSGIFMQSVMAICLFFMIWDKNLAVLLVTAPIFALFIVKCVRLFSCLRLIRKNNFYLKIDNTKLICNSIFEGLVELRLDDIKNIQFGDDGILVYLKRDVVHKGKLYRLFRYYLESTKGIYKIPVLGNKSQMMQVYDMVKQKIEVVSINGEEIKFSSLCGNYIFILAGALWGFFLQLLGEINLQQSIMRLLFLIAIMVLVRIFDKKPLSSNQVSVGLLIRCIGCSMTIAQYVLCACQIEELVRRTSMDLSVSIQSFFVISIIYLLVFVLFVPRNSVGKKFTLYCIEKRSAKKTNTESR